MSKPSSTANLTISMLARNSTLRTYLKNVRNWHGYIRFLGLPDRRDNPDIVIDRLFVAPLLTGRHVPSEEDPIWWRRSTETVSDALGLGKPLMILGDPGSGKSTLLNHLVWLHARATDKAVPWPLGQWMLPLPMLLRDLRLEGAKTFRGLLEAFLDHPMCEPLRYDKDLERRLRDEGALILLDGIDEIGDVAAREYLRAAVFDGIDRYPRCRWVLTSRIVGYEEVPFERPEETWRSEGWRTSRYRKSKMRWGVRGAGRGDQHSGGRAIVTRYIAPFDDEQIALFCRNWYSVRESAGERAQWAAADLVEAIRDDPAIVPLARVPNLLTLMALIHRVEAKLPDGRALLYDRIAEAYLESIDKFRGVYSGAFSLEEKMRWLGRVGYEMQRRRVGRGRAERGDKRGSVLVKAEEVMKWVKEEMERGRGSDPMSAGEFLHFVGRRSGLFLPRGEGRYAFVHLSFQEYFAAVAMEREVTGRNWAIGKKTPLGLDHGDVEGWAQESAWREAFVFLFERLARKEEWHAELVECIFGRQFEKLECGSVAERSNLGQLLARLIMNSHSGLARGPRSTAVRAGVRALMAGGRRRGSREGGRGGSRALGAFFGRDTEWNTGVLGTVALQVREMKVRTLSLSGTLVSDLEPLTGLELETLELIGTRVRDLEPVSTLIGLRGLDVTGTRVKDLGPLAGLAKLETLGVGATGVEDLRGLADSRALRRLDLTGTRIEELGPLAGLSAMRELWCRNVGVKDLGPLSGLEELEALDLAGSPVTELGPLAGLRKLRFLGLGRTEVSDVGALAALGSLEDLSLGGTNVEDVDALGRMRKLEELDLYGTAVMDVSALGALSELKVLRLARTKVEDVGPLGNLAGLRVLDLSGRRFGT